MRVLGLRFRACGSESSVPKFAKHSFDASSSMSIVLALRDPEKLV